MKYIVTSEIAPGGYNRDYMIHAISSKPEAADKKVVALKKKLEKELKNHPTTLRFRLQTIKITPWDGKTPLALFQFFY